MEPIVELATRVTTQLWVIYGLYPQVVRIEDALAQPWRTALESQALRDFSRFQGLLDVSGWSRDDDWDESDPLSQFAQTPSLRDRVFAFFKRAKPAGPPQEPPAPAPSMPLNARVAIGVERALDTIAMRLSVIRDSGLIEAIDRPEVAGPEVAGPEVAPPPPLRLTREMLFDRIAAWMLEPRPQTRQLAGIFHDHNKDRRIFFLEAEIDRRAHHMATWGRSVPGYTPARLEAAKKWEAKSRAEKLEVLLDRRALRDLCRCLAVAIPFSLVMTDELDEIARSRLVRLFAGDPAGLDAEKVRTKTGISTKPETHTHQAFDSCLFGLALSGGGIRSATFALGLMQGMADRNILPWIDVLSTVSGGGYIGSWLIAWIKRRGAVASVQESMKGFASTISANQGPANCPPRRPLDAAPDLAQPMSSVSGNSDPYSDHVRPMRLLRDYARYLAPPDSFFSPDTWSIGTIWLRNTSLNLVILLSLFSVVLLAPRVPVFVWRTGMAWIHDHRYWAVTIASVPLVLACCTIAYNLSKFGPYKKQRGTTVRGHDDRKVVRYVLAPILAGVFCESVVFWTLAPLDDTSIFWLLGFWLWLGMLIVGCAPPAFEDDDAASSDGPCGPVVEQPRVGGWWRWLRSRLGRAARAMAMATLLSAAVSFLMFEFFSKTATGEILSEYGNIGLWFVAAVGPAIISWIVSAVIAAFIGLSGNILSDEQREWWGRLGAWLSLYVSGWLAISAIAFFMPGWIEKLVSDWRTSIAVWAAGASWASITTAGVKFAFSARSGRDGGAHEQSWIEKTVLAVAPTVFAVGFLAAWSFLLVRVVRDMIDLRPAGIQADDVWKQLSSLAILIVSAAAICALFAWRIDINEFSMHHFYRNRLVRAYLGTSRDRTHRYPNAFTGFDLEDDVRLRRFQSSDPTQLRDMARDNKPGYAGPFPIINTALNITRGADLGVQERKAESFIFTPIWSGFDFSRRQGTVAATNLAEYAFQATDEFGGTANGGAMLGTAMAISGAAFNSNMGYHTSPALAFLLTVFGVRLGWWAGNPRGSKWTRRSPRIGLGYLVNELTADTGTDKPFVLLSDGGHFENMGLYELIRRRCRFIIVSDAEEDEKFKLEGIGGAIRKCRVDFGVVIDLNLDALRPLGDPGVSSFHYSLGTITYPDEKTCGKLLYIKASVTNDEPVDVIEFRKRHNEFPHTSTTNQFFDESHFESYRALGHHTAYEVFTHDMCAKAPQDPVQACKWIATMFEEIETDWIQRMDWLRKKNLKGPGSPPVSSLQ